MLRNKSALIVAFLVLFADVIWGQSVSNVPTTILKIDDKARDLQIKLSEEHSFAVELAANGRYSLVVDQKGIDVVVRLTGPDGHLIKEQDGPNGNNGPETIFVKPETKGRFLISVKPLIKKLNPPEGTYSIRVSRVTGGLPSYRLVQLQNDFDLLVGALKEAHAGLNWYSTYKEFEDFSASQRKLLRDKMGVLEFFRVIAPIVAFTKEGHTAIRLSAEDTAFLAAFDLLFPFHVKFLNGRSYVINDFDGIKSRGMLLTSVDGKPIDEIVKAFLSIEPDDGYIVTGKYRWIEQNGNFGRYYIRMFGESQSFAVELTDPKTGAKTILPNVRGVTAPEYSRLWREAVPKSEIEYPAAKLELKPEIKTAILTFNTFDTLFRGEKFDFKGFTAGAFDEIKKHDVQHLIVDIRKNDGGEEGLEDFVFAFLTSRPYTKYRYVQSSGTSYSFLQYTNYNTKERQDRLKAALESEHYLATDGRLLRKKSILPAAEPRPDAYAGDIILLTGGRTYSGGSEFASIVKGNRPGAIFVGEETGGGYYGNTSGSYLRLTLPNSKIWIRIPLLKFVVEVGGTIPFGRGVIPDHEIQPTIDEYLNGVDAEMNYALKLIRDKQ